MKCFKKFKANLMSCCKSSQEKLKRLEITEEEEVEQEEAANKTGATAGVTSGLLKCCGKGIM